MKAALVLFVLACALALASSDLVCGSKYCKQNPCSAPTITSNKCRSPAVYRPNHAGKCACCPACVTLLCNMKAALVLFVLACALALASSDLVCGSKYCKQNPCSAPTITSNKCRSPAVYRPNHAGKCACCPACVTLLFKLNKDINAVNMEKTNNIRHRTRGAKPNGVLEPRNQTKQDPEFTNRESPLTVLIQGSLHLRAIYHIFVVILLILLCDTVIYDLVERGNLIWKGLAITGLATLQTALVAVPVWDLGRKHLALASGATVTCEMFRFVMKIHAVTIACASRWQVAAIIFYNSFLWERFILPYWSDYGKETQCYRIEQKNKISIYHLVQCIMEATSKTRTPSRCREWERQRRNKFNDAITRLGEAVRAIHKVNDSNEKDTENVQLPKIEIVQKAIVCLTNCAQEKTQLKAEILALQVKIEAASINKTTKKDASTQAHISFIKKNQNEKYLKLLMLKKSKRNALKEKSVLTTNATVESEAKKGSKYLVNNVTPPKILPKCDIMAKKRTENTIVVLPAAPYLFPQRPLFLPAVPPAFVIVDPNMQTLNKPSVPVVNRTVGDTTKTTMVNILPISAYSRPLSASKAKKTNMKVKCNIQKKYKKKSKTTSTVKEPAAVDTEISMTNESSKDKKKDVEMLVPDKSKEVLVSNTSSQCVITPPKTVTQTKTDNNAHTNKENDEVVSKNKETIDSSKVMETSNNNSAEITENVDINQKSLPLTQTNQSEIHKEVNICIKTTSVEDKDKENKLPNILDTALCENGVDGGNARLELAEEFLAASPTAAFLMSFPLVSGNRADSPADDTSNAIQPNIKENATAQLAIPPPSTDTYFEKPNSTDIKTKAILKQLPASSNTSNKQPSQHKYVDNNAINKPAEIKSSNSIPITNVSTDNPFLSLTMPSIIITTTQPDTFTLDFDCSMSKTVPSQSSSYVTSSNLFYKSDPFSNVKIFQDKVPSNYKSSRRDSGAKHKLECSKKESSKKYQNKRAKLSNEVEEWSDSSNLFWQNKGQNKKHPNLMSEEFTFANYVGNQMAPQYQHELFNSHLVGGMQPGPGGDRSLASFPATSRANFNLSTIFPEITMVSIVYLNAPTKDFSRLANAIITAVREKQISVLRIESYQHSYHFIDTQENYTLNPFLDIVRKTYKDTRIYVSVGNYYDHLGLMMALDAMQLLDSDASLLLTMFVYCIAIKALLKLNKKNEKHGEYAAIGVDVEKYDPEQAVAYLSGPLRTEPLPARAFRSFLAVTPSPAPSYSDFAAKVNQRLTEPPFNFSNPLVHVSSKGAKVLLTLYSIHMDDSGDAEGNYTLLSMDPDRPPGLYPLAVLHKSAPELRFKREMNWPGGRVPLSEPPCGFRNEKCASHVGVWTLGAAGGALVLLILAALALYRGWRYEQELDSLLWKIDFRDLQLPDKEQRANKLNSSATGNGNAMVIVSGNPEKSGGSAGGVRSSQVSLSSNPDLDFRYSAIFTEVALYRGRLLSVKRIRRHQIDITREIKKELKIMRDLQHDNVNGFVGACIEPPNYHGALRPSNCLVDARWVVKLADFGLRAFRAGELPPTEPNDIRSHIDSLVYLAPELLRAAGWGDAAAAEPCEGSPAADVYAFALVLYEMHTRRGPFGADAPPGPALLRRLATAQPTPYRPPVDVLTAQFDCSRECCVECWAEEPALRPDFKAIRTRLRPLRKGMKPNIFDNMIAMMEKYANNLEVLVDERTDQLQEEKKKTEALLEEMLPVPVAEQLKRGHRVMPESYDSVTIYFSDIVGFTAMSAESTPLQVVDFLNDLYTCFDSILENFDVYKVETIGDAYMVVSGLPIRNGIMHAGEVASMALALLSATQSFRVRHRPDQRLLLRVGIHSGPVCAGVVGLKMPRYCLFGDTVNTASRFESTGAPLKIHCSSTCKGLLDKLGGYILEERGIVAMKGKRDQVTYWLKGEEKETAAARAHRRAQAEGARLAPAQRGDLLEAPSLRHEHTSVSCPIIEHTETSPVPLATNSCATLPHDHKRTKPCDIKLVVNGCSYNENEAGIPLLADA
ncbi:hypothetical protein MSG28_003502 [Choristoneura fumiferana]|uniref:Uncharacterized protein n=1 Tax=Choristoneura fumiferana TaxID=7141 RepID=A0ACC0KGD5_CHOFU|nr:hypothetical protein MSG28_003502 [Choristoneura fumiferana]